MGNLLTDASGITWCPKFNADVQAHSLAGCTNCPYATKIAQTGNGRQLDVSCSLVPDNKFCERIFIQEEDNVKTWSCLRDSTLEEYHNYTGDLSAKTIPEDFKIPKPTNFIKCYMCASFCREPSIPIEAELKKVREILPTIPRLVREELIKITKTEEARRARQMLLQLNPAWAERHKYLESKADEKLPP